MKKTEETQYSEFALNLSQKCPKVFWGDFIEKFLGPVLHGGSSIRKFSNFFFSKFQKNRKSFPKVSKRVLNVFWGEFFEKKILTSVPWRLEASKSWKKPKKTQYSEFALNRSQKCPKTFWGDFFEINLCPVLHGGSSFWNFSKKNVFKNPKMPQIVPKKTPNLFWTCFGANFSKYFMPSVPWRVESSKTFKKTQKFFKIPKMPKSVPKSIQTYFERVLEQILEKI